MIPVRQRRATTDVTMRPIETVFDNEYGGFDAQQSMLPLQHQHADAWCMIPNREFGTIVSAGGAVYMAVQQPGE